MSLPDGEVEVGTEDGESEQEGEEEGQLSGCQVALGTWGCAEEGNERPEIQCTLGHYCLSYLIL